MVELSANSPTHCSTILNNGSTLPDSKSPNIPALPAAPLQLNSVPDALAALRRGLLCVVLDDTDRENEADLIGAAASATPQQLGFIVRHSTGIICAPMPLAECRRLELSQMVAANGDPHATAFTVSVDAAGTKTGVSAAERSRTLRQLANPRASARDFHRPGHVFPLRAVEGGLVERRGHTEAAVELLQMAGQQPVGVIAELVNDDGTMKRGVNAWEFAKSHNLPIISVEQILQHRLQLSTSSPLPKIPLPDPFAATLLTECRIPVRLLDEDLGEWSLKIFHSPIDAEDHLVLEFLRDSDPQWRRVYESLRLLRVHSECLTGDVFGSQRCDCGQQLGGALRRIHRRGRGLVVYCRGHEGRGIGLANKIKAYKVQQDCHLDTFAANRAIGMDEDLRSFAAARSIIDAMGIKTVELLTGNPQKVAAFDGVAVCVTSLNVEPNEHNFGYLAAKQRKWLGNENSTEKSDPVELMSAVESAGAQPRSQPQIPEQLMPTVESAQSQSQPQPQNPSPKSDPILTDAVKSPPKLQIPEPELMARLKVGIITTAWNQRLVKRLHSGVRAKLLADGLKEENIETRSVPGAFELPFAAQLLSRQVDAVLCIGVLIKGETYHFEVLSHSVADGFLRIQANSGVPIINGVLNCLTETQAEERSAVGSILHSSLASTAIHMGAMKILAGIS